MILTLFCIPCFLLTFGLTSTCRFMTGTNSLVLVILTGRLLKIISRLACVLPCISPLLFVPHTHVFLHVTLKYPCTLFLNWSSINPLYYFYSVGCGGNFHKRCAFKIPNNCSDVKRRGSLQSSSGSLFGSTEFPSNDKSGRRMTWTGGRPVWIDRAILGRIDVPHTFVVRSYKKPTVCQICKKMVCKI